MEREFNLSWADECKATTRSSKATGGKAGIEGKAIMSVEEDIAKTIGINLGDTLTYDIAGSTFSAKVTSLRKVNWDSFRVNFFVVTPPGVLDEYPVSYITSFYIPPQQMELTNQLIKAFPNLLVIDVATIIAQVQKMIEQVTKAVEFVFLFTLLAGLAVLYAAIISTQDERIHEAAIFRALGGEAQATGARVGSRICHTWWTGRAFRRGRRQRAGICHRRICIESELHLRPVAMADRSGCRGCRGDRSGPDGNPFGAFNAAAHDIAKSLMRPPRQN